MFATAAFLILTCAAILAANTSMRGGEVKHVRRKDFDAEKRVVHIRTSKNETSKRVIPLNESAFEAVQRMPRRATSVVRRLLEAGEPDHAVESITGHLSRRMLEHYSHIRLNAKKAALDRLHEAAKTASIKLTK
ncbi:MAG: hypothetical protein ACREUZ_02630 [Burkholderiales bacterium]